MKHPFEPVCPSFGWLVRWSVIIFWKGGKFHFPCCYLSTCFQLLGSSYASSIDIFHNILKDFADFLISTAIVIIINKLSIRWTYPGLNSEEFSCFRKHKQTSWCSQELLAQPPHFHRKTATFNRQIQQPSPWAVLFSAIHWGRAGPNQLLAAGECVTDLKTGHLASRRNEGWYRLLLSYSASKRG